MNTDRLTKPPLLLRIYAFLTFPFSKEGSLVWWWRMHVDTHQADGYWHEHNCPYCLEAHDDQ